MFVVRSTVLRQVSIYSYPHTFVLTKLLSLRGTFERLQAKEVYLAITSEDASIVYYKLSNGIVKPPV